MAGQRNRLPQHSSPSQAATAFAQVLRRLRHERNFSQKEFADLIGVHVRQVSKYEMGTSMPTLNRIRRMAETLEVSADELVFGAHKQRANTHAIKNPALAERLRTLDQMVGRDELRSVIDLLDAFIAKKQFDQLAKERPGGRSEARHG